MRNAGPDGPATGGHGCRTSAAFARSWSLVRALPVRAAFACLTASGTPEPVSGAVPREQLDAAAGLGIELSSLHAPGDLWPAEVRNLLAYVLIRLERWEEALDQLRQIGPCVTSFPWDHISDDPLGQFLDARDGVRLEVAATRPLWAAGRSGRGDAH